MNNYISPSIPGAIESVNHFIDYTLTSVLANVHFGVPGGNGECLQIGICRVVIDTHSTVSKPSMKVNRECRQAHAYFSVNPEGYLEMFFPQEGILPCTERAVFKNKWFPVPEEFPIPSNLLSKLGDDVNPVIPAGKYPISRVENGYIISF